MNTEKNLHLKVGLIKENKNMNNKIYRISRQNDLKRSQLPLTEALDFNTAKDFYFNNGRSESCLFWEFKINNEIWENLNFCPDPVVFDFEKSIKMIEWPGLDLSVLMHCPNVACFLITKDKNYYESFYCSGTENIYARHINHFYSFDDGPKFEDYWKCYSWMPFVLTIDKNQTNKDLIKTSSFLINSVHEV